MIVDHLTKGVQPIQYKDHVTTMGIGSIVCDLPSYGQFLFYETLIIL